MTRYRSSTPSRRPLLWLVLLVVVAMAVPAAATPADSDGEHKVPICHITNSVKNPFVVIDIDFAAWELDDTNDHTQHYSAKTGYQDAEMDDLGRCPNEEGYGTGGGDTGGGGTGVISGFVFVDSNWNTVMDSSEAGAEGATVNLLTPDGSVASVVVGPDGAYRFENLEVGTVYLVTFELTEDGSGTPYESTTNTAFEVVASTGGGPSAGFVLSGG